MVINNFSLGSLSNRERCAFAHDHDDVEIKQRLGHRIKVAEMLIKRSNRQAIFEYRPVGYRQRNSLVVIQNGEFQRKYA